MLRYQTSVRWATGLILMCHLAAAPEPAPTFVPSITGISASYRSFAEIRIMLQNTSSRSIFLCRIWPTAGRLQRMNHATGKWETGRWPIRCGTVADALKPIEIKAGTVREVDLEWDLSVNDTDQPQWFITASDEQRTLGGTYRIVLEYAAEPWTVFQRPKRVLTVRSSGFVLQP
jgi:hypothetical protein